MKLYTTKKIAEILNLTERRVRQLRDEKVVYEVKSGLFDLEPTIKNYISYLRRGVTGDENAVDFVKERALLMRAKRKSEEYDLQLKENKLHEAADIEQVMETMLINFKSRLMAIPSKASPVLAKKTDKAEIYKILKELVDEALNELSDFDIAFSSMEEIKEENKGENE